jgi:hypothetical protein
MSTTEPSAADGAASTGRAFDGLPQVFGRYLLVQRMSRGGMGEIFLAKHGLAGFEKLAVIKKILPNLSADAQFTSRFVDEAQVAIKLSHVNIAQVFEVGRVGDEYFLALEHVDGRDLRRTFAALAARHQRMPVELALLVGRDIANGLAYAHRRTGADGASLALVHCDISPPNVLVSFEGETKIIDFGIARSALRATASDPSMGFGKFGYMAPEQLLRGGVIDHRTDIYAAGVVLYELLTGLRLYEAGPSPDFKALARAVARGEHPIPSQCDPALAPFDDLVIKALRPAAADRYQTAAELRDAIQTALVAVNPTVSADHLGAFMRDVFAAEIVAQREAADRIAHAHLADFEAQLQTQEVSTVSFAVAVAGGDVPADLLPGQPRAGLQPASPHALADGTRDVAPPAAVQAATGVRKRSAPMGLVIATVVAVAIALTLLLIVLLRQPPKRRPVEIAGSGQVTPDAARATFAPIADAAPGAGVPPLDAPLARPDAASRPRPDAAPRPDSRPAATVDARPRPDAATVDSGPDEAAVKAKFSSLARDYRAFKAQFGGRLEGDWADLATFAQYAKGPAKLAELESRISRFRSKMKAAE